MKYMTSALALSLLLIFGPQVHAQSRSAVPLNATTQMITPGQPVKVSIAHGQTIAFAFSAKIGEYASLVLTHSTYKLEGCSGCTSANITLSGPSGRLVGTQLSASAASPQGQYMNAVQLPGSGKYTITFTAPNIAPGTVDATLFLFNNVHRTITPRVGTTIGIKYPGQNAHLTFYGKAGQQVSFRLQKSTFALCHSCNSLTARVMPLAGPAVVWTKVSGSSTEASTTDATLPVSGRYTLVIDPQGARTGTVTVTLSVN